MRFRILRDRLSEFQNTGMAPAAWAAREAGLALSLLSTVEGKTRA